MLRLAALIALVGLAIPAASYAQIRPERLRVESCALSDSLLGGKKPDGHIDGAYDSVQNMTMLITEPERIWRPGYGLRGITGTAYFEGREPSATLVAQLNMKIVEPTERTLDQRQLVLFLDDSLRVVLGSMSMNPQRIPSVPGVTQNLYIVVPTARFYALARADKVRGTIGSTPFELTQDQHRDLRTLYIATVCGLPSDAK